MKKAGGVILLWLLLLFMLRTEGKDHSPPGKPVLTNCRSPEKETFTCWWEPGSDGGLPTTYALYYRKENSDKVFECPDYRTAGKNSCFFNKNDTSIWINYNITVVATNALGRTFSDPVNIDVYLIVKPNPPENLNASTLWDNGLPFLRVSWEPPRKADTTSGWMTLIYEVRVRLEEDEVEDEGEVHHAGQQKVFNIFSLKSGGAYLIQVRCKPDHGFWSEWTSPSHVKVPVYMNREKSMWILILVFSAFILLILTCLLHMKSRRLKYLILPPVPGPKIKGFDKELLKNGNCEDAFSSLMVPDFPLTASNYDSLLVEYLEVYIPEERELIMEETKDSHNVDLKSETSACDNDSGRGSCDSHTLLTDKDGKETEYGEGTRMELESHEEEFGDKFPPAPHDYLDSPDLCSEKAKTSPSSFPPMPQYCTVPVNLPDPQLCISEGFLTAASLSSYFSPPGPDPKEGFGSTFSEFDLSRESKQLQALQSEQPVQVHKDIVSAGAADVQQLPGLRSSEYVEVQRVKDENMVVLHPVSTDHESGCHERRHMEDYSKVKGVNSANGQVMLERQVTVGGEGCPIDEQPTMECSYMTPHSSCKPAVCGHTVLPTSGYIDTAAIFNLPTY